MQWNAFLVRRSERAEAARAQARDLTGAIAQALAPWSFAADPVACRSVADALQHHPPRPTANEVGAVLDPAESLRPPPPAERDVPEYLHRWRLARQGGSDGTEPGADESLAWALDELTFLGEQVAGRERGAWARARHTTEPHADARAAELWSRRLTDLSGRSVWEDQAAWEDLCLPGAMAAFRQVLSSREVPEDRVRHALSDLRDGFWFSFLGGGDGPPGWLELALRVVETRPPGPLEALGALPGPPGWGLSARCLAARGYWPATVRALLPQVPGTPARALKLQQRLTEDPRSGVALVELHAVHRLVRSFSQPGGGDPVRSWNVVVQNLGRARARLRAVIAASGAEELAATLLATDALAARTRYAARRLAWDQAWQALAHGLAWDFGRPVTPPCTADTEGLEPIAENLEAALRTWVLLVVLKGRLGHLERWTRTGGTGDRDGVWARLLHSELPEGLQDPAAPGRSTGSYHRLRAWLADGLDGTLAELQPLLGELAALPAGRSLRATFTERIGPRWDDRVPLPKSGFPTFCRHAAAAVAPATL